MPCVCLSMIVFQVDYEGLLKNSQLIVGEILTLKVLQQPFPY